MKRPDKDTLLQYEQALWSQGFTTIAGIDEAGRGPLAGPVVAGCAVFAPGDFIEGVWDSKTLSAGRRETLYTQITTAAWAWGVGIVDHTTIDRINIYEAAKLAMLLAIQDCAIEPDYLLTDAMSLGTAIPEQALIKGDQKSFTIAAASILAKVTRDRIMLEYHAQYPVYGWDSNKGYPTAQHRIAVLEHGYSPYHRRSFAVTDPREIG